MKTHRQYVKEQIEKDPTFAKELAEAEREVSVAVAIAELRERRGLSQVELARRAGLKQPQIARLESGAQLPALGTIWKLLDVLGGRLEFGPNQTCRITTVITGRHGSGVLKALTGSQNRSGKAGKAVLLRKRHQFA